MIRWRRDSQIQRLPPTRKKRRRYKVSQNGLLVQIPVHGRSPANREIFSLSRRKGNMGHTRFRMSTTRLS